MKSQNIFAYHLNLKIITNKQIVSNIQPQLRITLIFLQNYTSKMTSEKFFTLHLHLKTIANEHIVNNLQPQLRIMLTLLQNFL